MNHDTDRMHDYSTMTAKETDVDETNPYENMDPEQLLKMAAELDFLRDHTDDLLAEEEDSPFAEVRASVSNYDDPEMPCLTLRSLFLGIVFTIFGAALNTYFELRYPSPIVTPIVVQILAYPFGVGMARLLPAKTFNSPKWMMKLGIAESWSPNPGPFNIKEHTVIIIMSNVGIAPSFSINVPLIISKYFQHPTSFGFDILLLLSTQIVGFSFAGLCRRFLVWPAMLIWPQSLVNCTLLNTFHAEDDDGSDGSLTRFRYFCYLFVAAAIWYFVPGETKLRLPYIEQDGLLTMQASYLSDFLRSPGYAGSHLVSASQRFRFQLALKPELPCNQLHLSSINFLA